MGKANTATNQTNRVEQAKRRIQGKVDSNGWGKLPAEGLLQARKLDKINKRQTDHTVIYSCWCCILQGQKPTCANVHQIAELAGMDVKTAQGYTTRLILAGLLVRYECNRQDHGQHRYALTCECAGPKSNLSEVAPMIQSMDRITRRDLKEEPTKTEPSGWLKIVPAQAEPDPQTEPFLSVEDIQRGAEQLKDWTEKQGPWKKALREAEKTLKREALAIDAKNKCLEVEAKGFWPKGWLDLVEGMPIQSKTFLAWCYPRMVNLEQGKIQLSLPVNGIHVLPWWTERTTNELNQIGFSEVKITKDKLSAELSIFEIENQIHQVKIPLDRVESLALKELNWAAPPSKPEVAGLDLEKYGEHVRAVIDLASRASGKRSTLLSTLENWSEHNPKVIIRLVAWERQKAQSQDPIRYLEAWCKAVLPVIAEQLREAEKLDRN